MVFWFFLFLALILETFFFLRSFQSCYLTTFFIGCGRLISDSYRDGTRLTLSWLVDGDGKDDRERALNVSTNSFTLDNFPSKFRVKSFLSTSNLAIWNFKAHFPVADNMSSNESWRFNQ